MTAIDPGGPIPIYFQLKTLLLEEILSGRYGPEERLPTEHELCERFGISRTPVSRALTELSEEGVILRHRRRGTFVNPHWLQRRPDRAELRVMVPDGLWQAQMRQAVPADVRLSIASVALPDLHHALSRAVAEGRAPDLAVVDSVWVAEFARAGFLLPVEDLAEEWLTREYEADFLEPFVSANRFDGQTLAVQAEADVAGIWYRRDMLPEAGADRQDSWEQLAGTARRIAAGGRARHAIVLPGGSRGGETTTYCLLALLASNGVTVLEPRGVSLDCAATVETLRFVRRLRDEDALPAEAVTFSWDRPIRLLAEGQAALSLGGSYEARALAEATGMAMADLWQAFGFMPVPAGPRGKPANLAGGMTYAVFRQAAQPKQAMRLLQRLVATDALAAMARATGQIPPRRSAVRLVRDHAFLRTTAAMLERAVTRSPTPAHARVSAQLQSMLEAVITGRLGPAAATERAADLIGAITGLPVIHR